MQALSPALLSSALLLAAPHAGEVTTCTDLEATLADPGPSASIGLYARAVDVDGDVAAVGAPSSNFFSDVGAVLVYERTGDRWQYVDTLYGDGAGPADDFGASVSVDGDRIAIGAPEAMTAGNGTGEVHVYRRTAKGWEFETRVDSGGPSGVLEFGHSVSLDGDSLAVGSWRDNHHGPDSAYGSVYVFGFDGVAWSKEQDLMPEEVQANERFGTSVALDGDRLAVGARGTHATGASFAGSAYMFARSGGAWQLEQQLLPDDPQDEGHFGEAIALAGGTLVVGQPDHRDGGFVESGAAYVFAEEGSAWSQVQRLQALQLDHDLAFGFDVDAVEDRIAVGSRADEGAYLFVLGEEEWDLAEVLVADEAFDPLPATVALTHDTFATGAYATPPGEVRLHRYAAVEAIGAGVPGSGGHLPSLALSGCTLPGEAFSIEVSNGLGGAVGILLFGSSVVSLPVLGGTLYVAPPFSAVIPHQLAGAPGAPGAGTFSLASQLPPHALGLVPVVAQGAWVDPAGPEGASWSAALRLELP